MNINGIIENIRNKWMIRMDEEYDGRFEERQHPRSKNGQFAPKGSGEGGGGKGSKAFLSRVKNTEMHWAVKAAKSSQKDNAKWRVDVHDKSDYTNDKCFATKKGSTVAVTESGDIISVCKNRNDGNIKGSDLMKWAVDHGGVKLDSFSGNHGFYQRCGFTPISWTPFNEEYAPDGWKKGRDKAEEVIFYAYTGDKTKQIPLREFLKNTKPCTGENGYDDAMKLRDDYIGGRK